MSDPCSDEAYHAIVESGYLGERQQQVLKVFIDAYPQSLTATEVVVLVGRGFSENTRNRVTELEQQGYLRKAKVVRCGRTKMTVNLYAYTGRIKPKRKSKAWIDCPRCDGKGKVEQVVYEEDGDGTQLELKL